MFVAAHRNIAPCSGSLSDFKYRVPSTVPVVVTVTRSSSMTAPKSSPPAPQQHAISHVDAPSPSPEPTRKRKASPKQNGSSAASLKSKPNAPSKKRDIKKSPSGSRESSVSSAGKRVRSVRVNTRQESEEPTDYLYAPPPKRARSAHPFGSREKSIHRHCRSELDGRVEQLSSQDVVQNLLPTYISFFRDPSDQNSTKYQLKDGEYPCVELEYPNTGAREQFPLLVPKDPQHYNPIMELMESLEVIIEYYVPQEYLHLFGTLSGGAIAASVDGTEAGVNETQSDLLQKLRQAEHRRDGPQFEATLDEINNLLRNLKHGSSLVGISRGGTGSSTSFPSQDVINHLPHLKSNVSPLKPNIMGNRLMNVVGTWVGVPPAVWKTILSETYQRCVGPSVPMLREYTPHSSETYGELEASLVSDIVHQCEIGPVSKFIDLGSGVGNVCLQLSLQAGCETYGIEIRQVLHELAKKQREELEMRCRMWGLTASQVELEGGDFRDSSRARELLKEADVVLVNNFKFGPDLNASLVNMFLDMKEGAVVVTLAPLLPENFRISIHTMSNPLAIFQQEEHEYGRGSVSWSMVSGKYFINRVDRGPLRQFAEQNQQTIEDIGRKSKYNPSPKRRGSRRT